MRSASSSSVRAGLRGVFRERATQAESQPVGTRGFRQVRRGLALLCAAQASELDRPVGVDVPARILVAYRWLARGPNQVLIHGGSSTERGRLLASLFVLRRRHRGRPRSLRRARRPGAGKRDCVLNVDTILFVVVHHWMG